MKQRWVPALCVVAILFAAFAASRAEANPLPKNGLSSPVKLLRRCENNYSDDEIAAMIGNGEDGYEPDDCPLLAHTLTGPMLLNFCQPGDEDWVMFRAKSNIIYQIRAEPQWNYPTEPHLELFEGDGNSLIAQNDHYFGNNAEIWWWNSNAERTVYVRAIELGGRHDCGNSAYTLTLHAFTENPYPQATALPTSTATMTPTLTLAPTVTRTSTLTQTSIPLPTEIPDATPTPGG
jgi:hypothetical protein